MSFVFYDTETTGTNTAFDQILQFGAINTDPDLKEIDRFEIRCQLLPHIVPSPGALRVTGVSVEQLTNPSLPSHYQMIRAIREKLVSWSPAIFIGHNSLNFDEMLLRQSFYKTLHNPYLTNTTGNCRTDSLRLIQAVARFEPDALTIPTDARGRPIFKLDHLAPANGFDHSAAHDAMADVEATIFLCRLMMERTPEYWSGLIRYAQKAAVTEFALEEDVFSLSDFYYGRPYSWMVTTIGPNPDNGSELLTFNLSMDPDDIAGLTEEELLLRLSQRPKPVRAVRCNAAPIVLAYEDTPNALRDEVPALRELRSRAARIKKDEDLSKRLIAGFLKSRAPREPSAYVEEQIYDGFANNHDGAIMERFHELDWSQRLPLIDQLQDDRLRILGERLVHAEAPDTMDEQTLRRHELDIAQRLMSAEGSVPWLTLPKAIQDTHDLLANANETDAALLRDVLAYLTTRADALRSIIP